MIGGDFITFGNNRLKLTQFSHMPEVPPFLTLFHSTRALCPLLEYRSRGGKTASVFAMGGQTLRGIDNVYYF